MEASVLKKLHDEEVKILDEIVRICSKNNLEYFLIGGTLLGAIRHKGFIPWDDDLDIAMPREDYEKFLKIAEQELEEPYKLEYYKNRKLVFSTPITSGRNNFTKTGNFTIKNKARNTYLKGEDYVSFVQYWMGYGGGYGLHDASWRSRFGTSDYKTNGSHGCINLPTAAAKKLYGMIEVGTPLYIRK